MTLEPIIRNRGCKLRACSHFLLAWACLLGFSGCVVEKIDAIIAEHGVTYWPSSSGDDGFLDTSSTSTSSSAGTSDGRPLSASTT